MYASYHVTQSRTPMLLIGTGGFSRENIVAPHIHWSRYQAKSAVCIDAASNVIASWRMQAHRTQRTWIGRVLKPPTATKIFISLLHLVGLFDPVVAAHLDPLELMFVVCQRPPDVDGVDPVRPCGVYDAEWSGSSAQ